MKVLFINHNNILSDIIPHFTSTLDIKEADRVVVWTDVTSYERGVLAIAKQRGVPTITVQHGRSGTSRYYPPFNEEITADKLLVFGEADKKALLNAGHPEKKIKVVGTTLFDHLKERKPHEGINIVFSPDHWDTEVEENKLIAKELNKIKGVNIITKLVEINDPKLYKNPVISHRDSANHLAICAEVLSKADIVVSLAEGTFELLAQALDIPVVVMNEWKPKAFGGDERYKQGYRRIISSGSKQSTLKNLRKTIQDQLKNPGELREERKKAIVDEGGYGLDSVNLIKKEIIGKRWWQI